MNPIRKAAIGGALVAATLTGGALGATLVGSANAATTAPTKSATSSSTSSTSGTETHPAFPEHGTASHESAEKAVTGDAATKAQAAAVKSVGSGTAGVVTADFTGTGYETTVTKADGTQVEVRLDSTFTVEAGHGGHGGPGDGGGPDGH